MRILTNQIIANSDVTKNYRACREQAEDRGKVFIFKNNEPDAVLFSIAEYEKFAGLIEYAEYLEVNDIAKLLEALPKEGEERDYAMGLIRKDKDQIVAVDIIK